MPDDNLKKTKTDSDVKWDTALKTPNNAPAKTGRLAWLHKLKPSSKKGWILGSLAAVVLIAAAVFGGIALHRYLSRAKVNETPEGKTVYKPKVTTEPSRLTGVPVDPALNKRPVTGIMIENSPDARPQSGLKDAGIVFEAIAEGGITRFLTLFEEAQPSYIGPVRSARPYYLDWALTFDASLAHAGGSAEALALIKDYGVKDLDQFFNSSAYHRVSNRFAPHNLYTGFAELDKLNASKGYTSSNFTSWPRKALDKPAQGPSAHTIDLTISSVLYNSHYVYDPSNNDYKRSEGGKAHLDEKSGQQLAPRVVIALVTNRSQDGIYSVYRTTGSGTIYVFQDGVVVKGTWSKSGQKDQFVFKDSGGQTLGLNPGQTWVTVVAADSAVVYKP